MGLGAKRGRLERFDRKAMLEREGVFWRRAALVAYSRIGRAEGVASPGNIRASSSHWRAWVQYVSTRERKVSTRLIRAADSGRTNSTSTVFFSPG
jgi:hypothetical protein